MAKARTQGSFTDRLKGWTKTGTFWWNLFIFLLFCWLVFFRLLVISHDSGVHYHADFMIYINGEPQQLDHPTFYEETTVCGSSSTGDPVARVHLHDNIKHVIHVHDRGVTYGHLMANLGFNLGDNILQTRTQAYLNGEAGQLRFILNGREVISVANKLIGDEDVLLIDYGEADSATLMQRWQAIPRDAAAANTVQDPQGCRGDNEPASLWGRFIEALGF